MDGFAKERERYIGDYQKAQSIRDEMQQQSANKTRSRASMTNQNFLTEKIGRDQKARPLTGEFISAAKSLNRGLDQDKPKAARRYIASASIKR